MQAMLRSINRAIWKIDPSSLRPWRDELQAPVSADVCFLGGREKMWFIERDCIAFTRERASEVS